jgi:hypothetical protein
MTRRSKREKRHLFFTGQRKAKDDEFIQCFPLPNDHESNNIKFIAEAS